MASDRFSFQNPLRSKVACFPFFDCGANSGRSFGQQASCSNDRPIDSDPLSAKELAMDFRLDRGGLAGSSIHLRRS